MLSQRRLIPSTSMLLAFDASVRNGSFTSAAKELNLTQGAVSRQVSALESQINVTLFNRIRKSIQLTNAGKSYSDDLSLVLQALRNASLKVMSDPEAGIINFAVLPTFAMRWLMPRFPDFLKNNPQVTVNFSSKLSPFDFATEKLHAAIHYGLPDWQNTDCTFLMSEEVIPVASPSLIQSKLPLVCRDLVSLPLLHMKTRSNSWQNWLDQNNMAIKVGNGMVFEQFALVIQAAVASLGAALLPRFMIRAELERGELVELLDAPLLSQENYYLVVPQHYSNYKPIITLKRWLVNQT